MNLLGLGLLDLLLIAVAFVTLLLGLRKEGVPSLRNTAVMLGLVLLLHLIASGLRWQIIPAYLALLLILLVSSMARRWIRFLIFPFALLSLTASALASWAFPVFEIPEPTGPYAVGRTQLFLTDESREERYTDAEGDLRQLALHIWYPSDDADSGAAGHYWEEPVLRSRAVTNGIPLPWFIFTHLGEVKTHARRDASIALGEFPVIMYSHGLGIGWASGNTPLVEDLASRGYIVIAIGHSYIGSATIFPEHTAYFDPATREAMNTEPPEDVMAIHRRVKEIKDPEEQLATYMEAMAMMPVSIKGRVDDALTTQVKDQHFVLASLPTLQAEGLDLSRHMQTDAVGVFGMSIGGSASLITCSQTDLCSAAANMDGFHPDQAELELPVPSMILRRSDNLLVLENFKRAQTDAYVVEIADVTHFNFFDFTIMSPLYKKLGVLGQIDGEEMLGVSRDFLGAFFDKHLKGQEVMILEEEIPYPSENVVLSVR